jgi:transposase
MDTEPALLSGRRCSMAKESKGEKKPTRRERRKFAPEFKQEAVRLMYERRGAGVPMSQVARDLDVRPEMLRLWAHQLREQHNGELPGVVETPEQELRRLRRENATLRMEREFAKKVAVYFAKESR